MTGIRNRLVDGVGRPLRSQTVRIDLVAGGNPFLADGRGEVIQRTSVSTDREGYWLADLVPNADLENGDATHYVVDERDALPGGYVWTIRVPATGGPYWLRDVVVNVPPIGQPMPPVGAHSLGQHTNVDTSGALAGQALVYDGTVWRPGTVASSTTGGAGLLPLFNVEDAQYAGGAKGDGVTDDYPAVRAAWDAVLASPVGGLLYFPRVTTYRVVATLERLGPNEEQAYALFPIPLVPSQDGPPKRTVGVLGVGVAATVRAAASFDGTANPAQVRTASVLLVDYAAPFAWTADGLPSVFATPDADVTGHATDNIVANLHWYTAGLIVRQPNNPSLCGMNLELVSTMSVPDVRFDVDAPLDFVQQPTHSTGIAMLAPKSNNNVAVSLGTFVAEGMFGGAPYTEHMKAENVTSLRCIVGVTNRRPCSHMADMDRLKIEQCTFGLAGIDPSRPGMRGVVPWYGGTLNNTSCNFEHFAYFGEAAWNYTPAEGSDFYAERGGLSGRVYVFRVNAEPEPPNGIGIPPTGGSASVYVRGPNGDTGMGDLAIFTASTGAAQRFLGKPPSTPDAPTVTGVSTAVESAQVSFTPASVGPVAASYGVTVRRVDMDAVVGSATGAASPLSVVGLPGGVELYATAHAVNERGDSVQSAQSDPFTPSAGAGLPYDDFDGTGPLVTSTSGHTYSGNADASWARDNGAAVHAGIGTPWANTAWLPAVADCRITVTLTAVANLEAGLVARVTDADNLLYFDVIFGSDATTAQVELYRRVGGSFSGGNFGNGGSGPIVVSGLTAGQPVVIALECQGADVRGYLGAVLRTAGTDATQSGTGAGFAWGAGGVATLDSLTISAV